MGVEHLSFRQNFINGLLVLLVAIPCIAFTYAFIHNCPSELATYKQQPGRDVVPALNWASLSPYLQYETYDFSHYWLEELDGWSNVCRMSYQYPLVTSHVLLFLNMDVLFWVLSVITGSTWLIDPYWTFVPVLLAHWYIHHPLASYNPLRFYSALALLYSWSIRLTHSYYRREEWQCGAREDWRFTEMKKQFEKVWWWASFWIAYVSQHFFLFGISLPMYAIVSDLKQTPFNLIDVVAIALGIFGMSMAYSADTTLRNYMIANEQRAKRGEKKILVLEDGWWNYSRHPNYVGETIWWWSFALFAVNLGQTWMIWGAVINTLCLMIVTFMVEDRMVRVKERADAYRQYQKTTAIWLPWFKSGSKVQKKE